MSNSTTYFFHETAIIDKGCIIGNGSKIWHFSHIMSNCTIGKNCNIGQNVVVSPEVILGENVKIQNVLNFKRQKQKPQHMISGYEPISKKEDKKNTFFKKTIQEIILFSKKFFIIGDILGWLFCRNSFFKNMCRREQKNICYLGALIWAPLH